MTEQQIEQSREDLQQLDIDQLRCGVMLQLLKIDELTAERDKLKAAGKLALSVIASFYECDGECDCNGQKAIAALKKAGVK